MLTRRTDTLALPIAFLLILLLPFVFWDELLTAFGLDVTRKFFLALYYINGIIVCLLLATVLNRVTNILLWEGYFEKKLDKTVPKLLKGLVSAVVLLVAVAAIIGVVFEKSLTFIVAAAGGLSFIIGFAIKDMIADFFAGIALNIERPFKIGDYIHLTSGEEGAVVEMNWRSTHVRTPDNRVIFVPNSILSTMVVTNLYKSGTHFRTEFEFYLDFDIPPDQALRILNAAVKHVQFSPYPVHDYPNPISGRDLESDAIALGITEFGLKYRIRYWVPSYAKWGETRNRVVSSVVYYLKEAGINPLFLRQDFVAATPPPPRPDEKSKRKALLSKVGFFTSLEPAEIEVLANNLKERRFSAEKEVVRQGEPGSSMYIISEGLLYVYVFFEKEKERVKVAHLTSGQFFGEMSLFTGEPRAATVVAATDVVVYEITKEELIKLLRKRPEIVEKISFIIAEYQKVNQEAREKITSDGEEEEVLANGNQVLKKIRHFFGLK